MKNHLYMASEYGYCMVVVGRHTVDLEVGNDPLRPTMAVVPRLCLGARDEHPSCPMCFAAAPCQSDVCEFPRVAGWLGPVWMRS